MKRLGVILGLLIVLGGLAYRYWLYVDSYEPKPSRATFEQVQVGMTREQVVRITGSKFFLPCGPWYICGLSVDATLYVIFDGSGRVKEVLILPPDQEPWIPPSEPEVPAL